MNTQYNNDNIIAKDVHCPFCDSANAFVFIDYTYMVFEFV